MAGFRCRAMLDLQLTNNRKMNLKVWRSEQCYGGRQDGCSGAPGGAASRKIDCYLFFALQLFAEQLLLRGVQASLQTFHLLLQCLRGGGGYSVIKCLTEGGREGKITLQARCHVQVTHTDTR